MPAQPTPAILALLDRLAAKNLAWEIRPNGVIRSGCFCPLEADAGRSLRDICFRGEYRDQSGLSETEFQLVIWASDYRNSEPHIRTAMIDRLKPQEASS